MTTPWPDDDSRPERTSLSSDDEGLIVPPEDWNAAPAPAGRAETAPDIDGLSFTRATEHNSRAIIGISLSGVAVALILAFFAGLNSPLLVTVALAIGGIVMGLRGYLAARNGLATNGRLGVAAVGLGTLAILGVVAIYAIVLIALSQLLS